MPNLYDIMEIVDELETKKVLPIDNRCVAVRNRNAHCRKCVESCPVDAIEVNENVLDLDSRRCVACGACTTVCPTEALIPLIPLDEDLAKEVALACVEADQRAIIACARISSRREADHTRYTEVPCLARLEESLLLELATHPIHEIVLVDGVCRTCKYRSCEEGIATTVDSVNALIELTGTDLRVRRASVFPEDLFVGDAEDFYKTSRRSFFTEVGKRTKDTMGVAIKHTLEKDKEKKVESLRERLKITEQGRLPQFTPERHMNILDMLDRSGLPVTRALETRLWGSVDIDLERCNGCGMCAVFCPTGALAMETTAHDGAAKKHLEFSGAACVQCDVCADICPSQCLAVSRVVSIEGLFDLEPQIFEVAPRPIETTPKDLSSLPFRHNRF